MILNTRFKYIWVFCLLMAGISSYLSAFPADRDSVVCNDYSCCSKDDPTPAGIMISHVHKKNEWMISYKYMNMSMGGIGKGPGNVNKESIFVNYIMSADEMQMNMHMLMLMYNSSSMEMTMFSATHSHSGMPVVDMGPTMFTSGIGDVQLYLLYGALLKSNQQLLLSTGLGIPISKMQDNAPYSMQNGSGTYDILPCLSYLFQDGNLSFSTQLSSIIRTGKNSLGYKLGNEVTSNSWLSWQWHRMISTSLRLEGNLADRIRGYDKGLYYYNDITTNPFNYGGREINMYVGSVFQFKKTLLKKARFGIEYGIPVYQYVNGIQMKSQHALLGSCSWSF
jgi:hypothetical protein